MQTYTAKAQAVAAAVEVPTPEFDFLNLDDSAVVYEHENIYYVLSPEESIRDLLALGLDYYEIRLVGKARDGKYTELNYPKFAVDSYHPERS